MRSFPVRRGATKWFTLLVLLVFGASGCKEIFKGKRTVTFTCGDQTVSVDPTDGTYPKAVYLCAGDTLTWSANQHNFQIEFKKKSPFTDGAKKFDNSHAKSAPTKQDSKLTVYEYEITVDGKLVDDPQVIGGGGGS